MTTHPVLLMGTLRIEPALPDSALADTFWPADSEDASSYLKVESFADEDIAIVDGEVTVVGESYSLAYARVDDEDREMEAEAVLDEVRALLSLTREHGSQVAGPPVCELRGEASFMNVGGTAPLWRIKVVDGEPRLQTPTLVWPDGEEEKLP